MARSSLDGLKTGTGRADTSTGEPVRGFRAIRVFRWRILKVPKPRTSMFFCVCNDSLIASRNASTTRAQSFFEIIGPAVFEIWAVTLSTRSALVILCLRFVSAAGRGAACTELRSVNSYVSRVWATSATLGTHRFHELVEERTGVMGPGGRLGMILNGENRLGPVPQSLDRPIVQ